MSIDIDIDRMEAMARHGAAATPDAALALIARIRDLSRELEQERYHRRAAEDGEQPLAAQVERVRRFWMLIDRDVSTYAQRVKLDQIIEAPVETSLARRDAEVARSIHVALCEGADHNNLHKAPTAGRAVDFLLSLARQEVEKREPLRRQAEEAQ